MVSEKPSSPTETWKDWQVPGTLEPVELWTRPEILEAAYRLGVRRPDNSPVDERTMRYWESRGVLPRGTLSPDGYHQALYPWWVVDLLHMISRYQEKGVKIKDLAVRARTEAKWLSQFRWMRLKNPERSAQESLGQYVARMLTEDLQQPTQPPFELPPLEAAPGFTAAMMHLLSVFVPLYGQVPSPVHADRARLQFFDAVGEVLDTYDIKLRKDDPLAGLPVNAQGGISHKVDDS